MSQGNVWSHAAASKFLVSHKGEKFSKHKINDIDHHQKL